jgi:hypothetical protein
MTTFRKYLHPSQGHQAALVLLGHGMCKELLGVQYFTHQPIKSYLFPWHTFAKIFMPFSGIKLLLC